MDKKNISIVFSSKISDLTSCNSSFDQGLLRVAYVGKNRNNSFISKSTFERCMPSIYNCPIVCNYDRETDSIGSHDMEIVTDDDGSMRLVNITQPVGVIPSGAKYYWTEIEDKSGIHEYLCVDALIWKRQEAYKKIKSDGITDESMEISVKSGRMVDGVYNIDDFEFTGFCLLGSAEPCYESASLEVFSNTDFKAQLAEMMQEFKETFALSENTGSELTKEGEIKLNEKLELLAKFGLSEDQVDFDLESMTLEQLNAELSKPAKAAAEDAVDDGEDDKHDTEGEEGGASGEGNKGEGAEDTEGEKNGTNPENEPDGNSTDDNGEPGEGGDQNFALLGEQFRSELIDAIEAEKVETLWGMCPKYYYVDYKAETNEVFAYDNEDWKLYGFMFAVEGDVVTVDFETKQRKKFDIVDFEDGMEDNVQFSKIMNNAAEKFQAVNQELAELRQFKSDVENEKNASAINAVFEQFEDLSGNEAFESLKENHSDLSAQDIEEKCFAIRGRIGSVAKFSLNNQTPKLVIENQHEESEPYGGIFEKYGFANGK